MTDKPAFAGTTTLEGNANVHVNSAAGIEIHEIAGDPLTYRVVGPAFSGHDALDVTVGGVEVDRVYAERWLQWATVAIGPGFHPDTSAENYVTRTHHDGPIMPGLGPELVDLHAQLDEMLDYACGHLNDIGDDELGEEINVYTIAQSAGERAGLYDRSPQRDRVAANPPTP